MDKIKFKSVDGTLFLRFHGNGLNQKILNPKQMI